MQIATHRVFAAATLLIVAPLAVAAEATDEAEEEPIAYDEEMIVTVERREQNLQDLGATAYNFQGDDLKMQGAQDLTDLSELAPGLEIGNKGGNVEVWIRGVGSSNNTELGDPAAATHLDGVYPAAHGRDRLRLLRHRTGGSQRRTPGYPARAQRHRWLRQHHPVATGARTHGVRRRGRDRRLRPAGLPQRGQPSSRTERGGASRGLLPRALLLLQRRGPPGPRHGGSCGQHRLSPAASIRRVRPPQHSPRVRQRA